MMYAGHYSVAKKLLHPLAIKARGKKQPERGTRGGRNIEKKRTRRKENWAA
jgi:hypothetical protein